MPLDPAFIGRSFVSGERYHVGSEKIREFAAAIGDRPDAYLGAAPVAPPTFAIAVLAAAQDVLLFDPALGLDFSRVVHRDQRFTHHRPIRGGDVLASTVVVDGIRQLAGNDVLTLRSEITDETGSPVCTAVGTLVSRAAE